MGVRTVNAPRHLFRRFAVLGAAAVAAFQLGNTETSLELQLAVAVAVGIGVAFELVPGSGRYIRRPKQTLDQE